MASEACAHLADRVALERILANLMENARTTGTARARNRSAQRRPEAITIQISDRGPGIPADQLEPSFRPFHRLESSRSHNTGGSGLGLAIARQLADKHGWKIKLRPRDGGGTVRTGLPLAPYP